VRHAVDHAADPFAVQDPRFLDERFSQRRRSLWAAPASVKETGGPGKLRFRRAKSEESG
jgi:hypothetical protein